MEASRFNRRTHLDEAGFSMLELLISTVVLSVGLLSLAAFISKMDLTTNQSRYSSTAALLCSEKLEELSGYTPQSPEVKIVSGHSAGSLSTDQSATVAVEDGSELVSYYDIVTISATNGSIRESTVDATGQHLTISQTPNGVDPVPDPSTIPANDNGVTFKRRWLIEDNVSGFPSQVRRITVRVEYPSGAKTASFQMTMVRNAEQ